MSTNVSTGWLKDNNGEKFAPKTTSTQVIMSDGNSLENKIKNLGGGSTKITIIEDGVESTLNGMRINKFDTKDEYKTALENGEIADNEFCSFPEEYDEELNAESTNAIQNKVVAGAISEISAKIGQISYNGHGYVPGNGNLTIESGTGLFLVVATQGGSLSLCGITLVCVTAYDDGCFAKKIAGGGLFDSNISFTVNAASRTYTVNNTHIGSFYLSSYKIA